MAANTSPIFTLVPNIGIGGAVLGPNANTAQDGTGANSSLVFTAGTEGSWVSHIRLKSVVSPAATVVRVFYCSDTGAFTPGTTNTAANSSLIMETSVPATTQSQTSAQLDFTLYCNFPMPPSTKLFVTFGTSTGAAGTGYAVTVFGGDY